MTIEEIRSAYVELYREKVLEVGAYRTGALYDSIECLIDVTGPDGPDVSIIGIEYLPFVDEGTRYIDPRHITDKWLADPEWDRLYNELLGIWADGLVDDMLE